MEGKYRDVKLNNGGVPAFELLLKIRIHNLLGRNVLISISKTLKMINLVIW